MMGITFFKGLLTGFLLSLPFGPVGIYCMEKTLIEGEKEGYFSAIGMVTVDVIYGITAYLFVNQIGDTIIKYETYCKIAIGIFLMVVGLKKFLTKTEVKKIDNEGISLFQNYLTTFAVSIANISSILIIAGIFTALKVTLDRGAYVPLKLASGIFIGGASLWFLTTYILYHFKKKVTEELLIKISKFAGGAIFSFGLIATILIFV